jgi:hypothetical protein
MNDFLMMDGDDMVQFAIISFEEVFDSTMVDDSIG